MSDRAREQETLQVDQAMNRVLAAEQEARQAVEATRAQAAAIVAAAEETAAAIGRRAERRIRGAHQIADRAVERALAELAGTRPVGSESSAPAADAGGLARAVSALADEIVGGLP
jgi:hypothetical protein